MPVGRTPISVVLMRLFACFVLGGGVYSIIAGSLIGACSGPSIMQEGCCEVVFAYIAFSLFPREYEKPVNPPAESSGSPPIS